MENDDQSLIAKVVAALIALVCGGAAVAGYVVYERRTAPIRPPIVPGSVAPAVPTKAPPPETGGPVAPSPTTKGSISVPGG
jgi:hypothetical protein